MGTNSAAAAAASLRSSYVQVQFLLGCSRPFPAAMPGSGVWPIADVHKDAVKEITRAHERTIETLWEAWRKEQQALKQMVANQEKTIEQLRQDIQGIRA